MARVLIVDDDAVMRVLISRALSAAGYAVETVESGEAALRSIRSNAPDLVLLDRMMPGLTGDDVLFAIREDPALADLPVIMLTAMRETEHVVTGFSAGATDYLAKPFDLHELRARVASRLDHYGEQRAIQAQIRQLQQDAATDPLTGLANRRGFEEALRDRSDGSVLLVDVDGLKQVNDRYGHAAGDRFLREIASRLRALQPSIVARLGGDEFALACDDAGDGFAERVRRAISDTPFRTDDGDLPITVSVGYAPLAPNALEIADKALYRAKAEGKNRIAGPPSSL